MIAAFARAARVLAPGDALGEGVGGTGAHHLQVAQRCAAFVRDAPVGRRDADGCCAAIAAGNAGIDGVCRGLRLPGLGPARAVPGRRRSAVAGVGGARCTRARRALRRGRRPGLVRHDGRGPDGAAAQLEEYDGAEPAATSVAVMNLLALARLTGRAEYQGKAERVLAAWGARLRTHPRVAPFMLAAASTALLPPIEIAVAEGNDARGGCAAAHALASRFLPSAVVVPVTAWHRDAPGRRGAVDGSDGGAERRGGGLRVPGLRVRQAGDGRRGAGHAASTN